MVKIILPISIIILIILGFVFYWFQIRLSNIYSRCEDEAISRAKSLAVTKSEIDNLIYAEAAERGMFVKSDYEYAYKQCLRKNGIDK